MQQLEIMLLAKIREKGKYGKSDVVLIRDAFKQFDSDGNGAVSGGWGGSCRSGWPVCTL